MDKATMFGRIMRAFDALGIKTRRMQVEFVSDVLEASRLPQLSEQPSLAAMSTEQFKAVLDALDSLKLGASA